MRQEFDLRSLEALEHLLARPDPWDLAGRGNVLRWAGDPDRRATRLPVILMGWLQRRCLEVDPEEPIPSARVIHEDAAQTRRAALRVLRPTDPPPVYRML